MRYGLVLIAAIACSACTHQMTLAERGGGIYSGQVSEIVTGRGDMSATIDGKTLAGQWTTASGAGTGLTFGGGSVAVSTFNSTSGNAQSIMTSSDGSKMVCKFSYGYMNGVGLCLMNDTRLFDMQFKN